MAQSNVLICVECLICADRLLLLLAQVHVDQLDVRALNHILILITLSLGKTYLVFLFMSWCVKLVSTDVDGLSFTFVNFVVSLFILRDQRLDLSSLQGHAEVNLILDFKCDIRVIHEMLCAA